MGVAIAVAIVVVLLLLFFLLDGLVLMLELFTGYWVSGAMEVLFDLDSCLLKHPTKTTRDGKRREREMQKKHNF